MDSHRHQTRQMMATAREMVVTARQMLAYARRAVDDAMAASATARAHVEHLRRKRAPEEPAVGA